MSKKCITCRFFKSSHCRGVCTLLCCTTTAGEWCRNHEDRILFDHITQSVEVLAEKLVYAVHYGGHYFWHSTLIYPAFPFDTKEQAIAATVKKLKEVLECP